MVCDLRTGCRRTQPRWSFERALFGLLPGRRLVCGVPRRRPRLRHVVEQDRELRRSFCLQRPAHPIVELRCVDPALRHVLLKKTDCLVTGGVADSRFHRSPCRTGRLVLRRLLGGIRLGCGRLSHNHQYPRAGLDKDQSQIAKPLDSRRGTPGQCGPRSTEVRRLIRG
jgi:hypothetical protein